MLYSDEKNKRMYQERCYFPSFVPVAFPYNTAVNVSFSVNTTGWVAGSGIFL